MSSPLTRRKAFLSFLRPTRSRWSPRRREAIAFYLFISPWIVGLVIFTLGPMLASLGISFTEYNLLTPPRFLGLENYKIIVKYRQVLYCQV
jgi:ABC-type sugar transport system permease subunit